MYITLNEIGKKFRLPGTLNTYEMIPSGIINSTYKVTYTNGDGSQTSYLFQRINTHVFKNPVEIMRNIDRVTEYISENYPDQTTLHYYHSDEGVNYCVCDDSSFWRIVNYVNSVTYDSTEDLDVIEAAGKAFGQFQAQLNHFDGSVLYETIPDFHHTKKRLDTLFAHVEEDSCGRASEVQTEIAYIASVREKAAELSVRFEAGEIPKRVTHNDTKCSNVLFDWVTKEPIVVIDLDTIMPGMSMYDFGDAVRCIANTVAEDEQDETAVSFDTEKFRAFARGFIGAAGAILEPVEMNSLVQAAFSITVELASRFLDDYLTGDHYFRCEYPGHNLVRARGQLQLARDIEAKWTELSQIIREVADGAAGCNITP